MIWVFYTQKHRNTFLARMAIFFFIALSESVLQVLNGPEHANGTTMFSLQHTHTPITDPTGLPEIVQSATGATANNIVIKILRPCFFRIMLHLTFRSGSE